MQLKKSEPPVALYALIVGALALAAIVFATIFGQARQHETPVAHTTAHPGASTSTHP
jgi:hypothetical protein